jgi:3-mercaptopyruvate sulfurtransferase SseA
MSGSRSSTRWVLVFLGLSAAAPLNEVRAQAGEAAAARISVTDLKQLLVSDGVIVLDVRSAEAYARGHIPGALSVPLESVERRAGEWRSATKPIVTYCT